MPEIFHWIEFWRIGRQRHQRHICGNLQFSAGMEARLVPNHHHLYVGIDLGDELLKEYVDDIGVDGRRQQSYTLAGSGAGGSKDVEPLIPGLSNGTGTSSFASPNAGQRPLLTEPGFILEPDLEGLAGVFGLDLVQDGGKVFLNSSCAAGSACSCLGRGHR